MSATKSNTISRPDLQYLQKISGHVQRQVDILSLNNKGQQVVIETLYSISQLHFSNTTSGETENSLPSDKEEAILLSEPFSFSAHRVDKRMT